MKIFDTQVSSINWFDEARNIQLDGKVQTDNGTIEKFCILIYGMNCGDYEGEYPNFTTSDERQRFDNAIQNIINNILRPNIKDALVRVNATLSSGTFV